MAPLCFSVNPLDSGFRRNDGFRLSGYGATCRTETDDGKVRRFECHRTCKVS